MNNLNDFLALAQIFPVQKGETGISWVSRARAEGILNEDEWTLASKMVKAHLYLFSK